MLDVGFWMLVKPESPAFRANIQNPPLQFWLGWRQLLGFHLRLKSLPRMGPIAERLVLRHAAAAKGDHGPAAESILFAFTIANRHLALQTQRAVMQSSYN